MTESTLSSSSKYDDQGLFLSLIVGAAILFGFGGFIAFLHCTSILWLKRFYRPNHTVEPEPLASARTGDGAVRRASSSPTAPSPTSPSSPAAHTVFAEHTVRPHGRRGLAVTRRKRLGISLPYTSTFFVRPSWRDLISIEEPSLRDRKDGALAAVHTRTPAAALRHTSDRSFVPLRTTASPMMPLSPGDVETFPAEYPPVNNNDDDDNNGDDDHAVAAEAATHAYSPCSGPGTPSYGAMEVTSSTARAVRRQPQTRAMQTRASQTRTSQTSVTHIPQPGDALPKTPTDPLVAVYLFTLKYFFALMFFGAFFTVWIMFIASSDDYMRRTMVQRDIHGCSKQDDNKTGCEALKPYCKFRGIALGCAVVPLHGIYDLTLSNIKPRSWRWAPVAVLNLGFCLVLVLLTLFYLRKVGQYVEAVMARQMRHALGYRVVCIRGLDTTDIRTEEALRRNFLELSVYFPSDGQSPPYSTAPALQQRQQQQPLAAAAKAASSPMSSPGAASPRRRRERVPHATMDSIFGEYHSDDDVYTICECPGLNCLFSTAGAHYYVVRREDAAFTEPGKVEQILITREPPYGLLDTIADTESAMADLQEAIADEKALQRKYDLQRAARHAAANGTAAADSALRRRRHVTGAAGVGLAAPLRTTSVVVSNSNDTSTRTHFIERGDDKAVLMMRGTFPGCCDKMPAVPYYESVFFKYAVELNHALERVPHQPVAGAAFVVFKDSLSAFEFMQLFTARFGGLLSSLTATIAGPPGRIFQNSLTAGRCALCLRFFLIFILYVVLIFTWSIPISFLGSLESLSEIPGLGSFLTYFTGLSSTIQTLVNAYLPVVVLALFNVALPHIIRVLVRMMGAFNRMECDGGQLYLQYVFMVMTAVIAQAAFQGALTRMADLLFNADEEAIINFLIACVTPSNGYFYAKIISATCLSTWVDLLDPIGILKALLLRGSAHIQRNYDALFMPCEFEFPRLLSFDLMILSMGLLFHMTTPLLGLLSVAYFFVRYWTQRAKQTDRYRPTLSPVHDCTDFGVPAQVIRSVMWLYCFAELGGVLLMGLRDHRGGVVLCSLSLGTGIALTIFVYIKTRRWTACLACARHFSEKPHPYHHTHPIRARQRLQEERRQSQMSGSNSAAPSPVAAAAQRSPPSPKHGQSSSKTVAAEEPTVTTPLRSGPTPFPRSGPSSASSPGRHPASPPQQQQQRSASGREQASLSSSSNNNSSNSGRNDSSPRDAPFETNPEDDRERRQLGVNGDRLDVMEEGAMDSYENMTLQQVLFDTARNPFLSHLLPRKAGVTLRFQPKHQRLAPIDAAAEVRIMHNTNFVVERYWDRGMTWFEEDTADMNWDGEVYESNSTDRENDGETENAERLDGAAAAISGSSNAQPHRSRSQGYHPSSSSRRHRRGPSAGPTNTRGYQEEARESKETIQLAKPPSRLRRSAADMTEVGGTAEQPAAKSPEAVVLAVTRMDVIEDTAAAPPPPPSASASSPTSAASACAFSAAVETPSPPLRLVGTSQAAVAVPSAAVPHTGSQPSSGTHLAESADSSTPPLPLRGAEERRVDADSDDELLRRSTANSAMVVELASTDASATRAGRAGPAH